MKSKYYTVDVSPTFVASEMHAAAYTANDIIFKGTEIEVPKGIGKLISAQVMYRGIDGVAQDADINLIFTNTNMILATGNNAGGHEYNQLYTANAPSTASGLEPRVLGSVRVNNSDAIKLGSVTHASSSCGIALSSATGGSNVGVDKFYMHATCGAQVLDLRSSCIVDGTPGTGQANLDISDVVAKLAFAPGDIVHDEDDRLMGTVSVLTDDTNVLMAANLANAGVNAKKLYALNPMHIRLVLEK